MAETAPLTSEQQEFVALHEAIARLQMQLDNARGDLALARYERDEWRRKCMEARTQAATHEPPAPPAFLAPGDDVQRIANACFPEPPPCTNPVR